MQDCPTYKVMRNPVRQGIQDMVCLFAYQDRQRTGMATWPGLGVKVDGDALIIRPRNQPQDVPVTGQTDDLKMLQTAPNNNAVYELFWVETNQADRWYFKKQNTYF